MNKILFMIPSCYNCKFFISHPKKFDDLAKCSKFIINLNNNKNIFYEYAEKCRIDEQKCGIYGKEFKEK